MATGKTNAGVPTPAKLIKYDNSDSGLSSSNVQAAIDEVKGDIPTTLPANGGNADTVDGKHASDFATAGHDHDGVYADADHDHNYAGSTTAGGSANSAVKLDSNAGSETQPVYFSGGKPVKTTHTLEASVPSDAKFTDTTYEEATTTEAGLFSPTEKTKLSGIEEGAQVNKVTDVQVNGASVVSGKVANILIDSELSDSSENPVQNMVVKAAIDAPFEVISSDTFTWDGDTEGLEVFQPNSKTTYYKISDNAPSYDELQAAIDSGDYELYIASRYEKSYPYFEATKTSAVMDLVQNDGLTVIRANSTPILYVYHEGNSAGADPGMYAYLSGANRFASLTIPGYSFEKTKLKSAYLPGYEFEGTVNALQIKAFETGPSDTIIWDEDTPIIGRSGSYYRVHGDVGEINNSILLRAAITYELADGSRITEDVNGTSGGSTGTTYLNTLSYSGYVHIYDERYAYAPAGVWFKDDGSVRVVKLQIEGEAIFEVPKLKKEHLPDISASVEQGFTAETPENITINSIENNSIYNELTKMLSIDIKVMFTTTGQIAANTFIYLGTLTGEKPRVTTALAVWSQLPSAHRLDAKVEGLESADAGKICIKPNLVIASGTNFTLYLSGMCMLA